MRITSLTLFSNDIVSQKEFYVDCLGFRLNSYSEHKLSIQAGNTELVFLKSTEHHVYHYCFLVPNNQLETALAWLQSRVDVVKTGQGFIVESSTEWNARSIYFFDGNGNIAEFITHYDLENSSKEEFSAKSIISINEIGCPSQDILTLNRWIENTLGTQFWTGNTTRFGTNGNEEGCFLMVNNAVKKTWFPTELFPESAPFEISIDKTGSEMKLAFFDGKFEKIS